MIGGASRYAADARKRWIEVLRDDGVITYAAQALPLQARYDGGDSDTSPRFAPSHREGIDSDCSVLLEP